ncbi:SapC family protein [Halomonas sp. CH40]
MPNIIPLQHSVHANAGFQRARNFEHAQQDRFVPVLLDELSQVITTMPVCLIRDRSSSKGELDGFRLVALQALEGNQNLYLNPQTLQWMSRYTPAYYRSYPFVLGVNSAREKRVLCFNLDSGLLREHPTDDDVLFFDQQGSPSQELNDTMRFLEAAAQGRQKTQKAVEALEAVDLIQEWPMSFKQEEKTVAIKGIYRINETAMNALPDDTLQHLQQIGALKMAYSQLLSMPQLKNLAKLRDLHSRAAEAINQQDVNDLLNSDDSFHFDFDS